MLDEIQRICELLQDRTLDLAVDHEYPDLIMRWSQIAERCKKWPKKCPDDLKNEGKIAMWDPLSDPNLDQCS